MPSSRRRHPRGVVDTSVLLAGIAGLKQVHRPANASARLLQDWIEKGHFQWLFSEDVIDEYKHVLARRNTRPHVIGRIVNLLREEGELIELRYSMGISTDPGDDPFCDCAEVGQADFIVTLNKKDFPQARLSARVIVPGEPIPTARRFKARSK